jgi:RHS repeat-associated protein
VQWDDRLGLGLAYMHARHYSPALGRFLQPDPDRSEANLYAYAANNPVTELDPDGTCFIVCQLVIGLVLFGGLGAAGYTATYALETPRDNWSAEGARAAAVEGAISGASVVPVGRVAGLATRVASKVPKASRAANWARKAIASQRDRAVRKAARGAMSLAMRQPKILRRVSPELGTKVARRAGWRVDTLQRGSAKGRGVKLMEQGNAGQLTGRQMRWHPGGGHHGPRSYWRVARPGRVTVRIYQ